MLNEQNQMVNAAGQALMALPVDSTNKADFSEPLRAMAIPRTTVAEFSPTSEVELGLNLPSTAEPITAAFNPNKRDVSQDNFIHCLRCFRVVSLDYDLLC